MELHTFAVGQDILDRFAVTLGVARGEIEAAYASEHGARFFQMYAIRLAALPAGMVAEGLTEAVYPPDVSDVSVMEETIDGRAVTVVHAPSAAARLGTFYLYAMGPTLFVVQALEPDVAVEALGSLP